MSEDEFIPIWPRAKDQWCPFSRIILQNGTGGGFNRIDGNQPNYDFSHLAAAADCVASQCAAWREDEDGTEYCGLAGRLIRNTKTARDLKKHYESKGLTVEFSEDGRDLILRRLSKK